MDFGLGLSRRDTYILDWQQMANVSQIYDEVTVIEDGVPAWPRARAINNGK